MLPEIPWARDQFPCEISVDINLVTPKILMRILGPKSLLVLFESLGSDVGTTVVVAAEVVTPSSLFL